MNFSVHSALLMAIRRAHHVTTAEREDFYDSHRLRRVLDTGTPLRPLPDDVTDLDHFRFGSTTVRVAASANIAWWRRFSAPNPGLEQDCRKYLPCS